MAEEIRKDRRSHVGYGSSYRKANRKDFGGTDEIGAVLGGQVWMVKPDRQAKPVHPCLWMQAGAVKFKGCNNYYDCTSCKYDQGMRSQVEKGKQESWQDAMRKRAHLGRVCRHSLTGRIEKRACAYNYECAACDFDQFFEDVWTTKSKSMPTESRMINGFHVPMDRCFHDGHGWARVESGGFIRIGLDDFALKVLGKADALDLPLMGKELNCGTPGWGLRRRDHLADVLSPVDGVIVEVNGRVRESPELANREPYGDGWLFVVRTPDIKKSVKNLMADEAAIHWINGEIHQLEAMIESVAGPLAADGGLLADDVYGNMPGLGWKNLTRTFLKS